MPIRAVADGIFADVGSGAPTVLALHGWGRNRPDWDGVLDPDDRVAVDLPGFGASPPPPAAWGAHEYAAALAPVLEVFDAPPVVVGHSFGGRVAVCLAASGAEVAGLVLAGVPLIRRTGSGGRSPAGYRAIRWAHGRGLVDDERLEAAKRRYGSADYRAAAGVMRDVLVRVVNESYERELAGIAVPTRLVWGADDTAAPLAAAEEALGILRSSGVDADLTVVADVGHDVHRARPEAVAAAVEALR
ncbi:MAG: alpha/beta hydrolase [Acidimicrobiia bacterium]